MDNRLWQHILDVEEDNNIAMKVKAEGARPKYANKFAAGLDLSANNDEKIILKVGEKVKVPTKVKVELPKGTVGLVVGRSGLGVKKGITLANGLGVIDEDYRGEIGVVLINNGEEDFEIKQGDRIAQMVIVPCIRPSLIFVNELGETERGEGGFGSTGR